MYRSTIWKRIYIDLTNKINNHHHNDKNIFILIFMIITYLIFYYNKVSKEL